MIAANEDTFRKTQTFGKRSYSLANSGPIKESRRTALVQNAGFNKTFKESMTARKAAPPLITRNGLNNHSTKGNDSMMPVKATLQLFGIESESS